MNDAGIKGTLAKSLKDLESSASKHFGQPYFNNTTMAGLYRMMLKEMAQKYHVQLDEKNMGQKVPCWCEHFSI